eukprot:8763663-Alexandrium_andersonii.AAC.1
MKPENPAGAEADVEMDDFHSADDGESDEEAARMEESCAEELAQFEAVLAQEPEHYGVLYEEQVARALEQEPSILGLAADNAARASAEDDQHV